MRKSCSFIRLDGNIYVPAVSIWLEGWTRQRWLERHFGNEISIISVEAESWAYMAKENTVVILEEEGNIFREIENENGFAKSIRKAEKIASTVCLPVFLTSIFLLIFSLFF